MVTHTWKLNIEHFEEPHALPPEWKVGFVQTGVFFVFFLKLHFIPDISKQSQEKPSCGNGNIFIQMDWFVVSSFVQYEKAIKGKELLQKKYIANNTYKVFEDMEVQKFLRT